MTRNVLPSYALLGQEAEGTTAEEVLANAGLDFEVKKAPSGYMNHDGQFIGHRGHSVTYRADTGMALGNVGSTYHVYQNVRPSHGHTQRNNTSSIKRSGRQQRYIVRNVVSHFR